MAQKDYVGRGRSTRSGRNNRTNRNKKRSGGAGISRLMPALAIAVLVVFIGGLWFITHHKKSEPTVVPNHKVTGNSLPPKPEERWKYIKELENRQVITPTPTEPTAGGEVRSQTQLTSEQRQLLEQMQADMRQQPTSLAEVPGNKQATAQQRQQLPPQQSQPQSSRLQPNAPISAPRETVRQSATTPAVPATKLPEATVTKENQERTSRWIVQCGSFKGNDQAESIRAQLAFEGFESRVTTAGGWNRVIMGPYNSRNTTDSTLKRLHNTGHTNCIPVSAGG